MAIFVISALLTLNALKTQYQKARVSPMESICKPGGALLTNAAKEKSLVVFAPAVIT
ncbi:hypothetical protein [Ruegeria halocynthiae]|uniref:hypothetical protein n=1 Tax=Ruegeria halocynthiae TaxID=985054 RepID=UPI001364778D|nr:hypothetical protein [Ruegeria halocynthiae]